MIRIGGSTVPAVRQLPAQPLLGRAQRLGHRGVAEHAARQVADVFPIYAPVPGKAVDGDRRGSPVTEVQKITNLGTSGPEEARKRVAEPEAVGQQPHARADLTADAFDTQLGGALDQLVERASHALQAAGPAPEPVLIDPVIENDTSTRRPTSSGSAGDGGEDIVISSFVHRAAEPHHSTRRAGIHHRIQTASAEPRRRPPDGYEAAATPDEG
jgi:hypothetical protein